MNNGHPKNRSAFSFWAYDEDAAAFRTLCETLGATQPEAFHLLVEASPKVIQDEISRSLAKVAQLRSLLG